MEHQRDTVTVGLEPAGFVDGLVLELQVERLGMRTRDRHPDACAREPQLRMVQHLARLVAHLELLQRVPVRLVELVDVRDEVVHQLVLERLDREGAPLGVFVDLLLQLGGIHSASDLFLDRF